MPSYQVVFTQDAEQDLEDIYDYISVHDSLNNANYVLDELLNITNNLTNFPDKGSIPCELQNLGINTFRQVYFKPYRLIYQVIEKQVVVFIVVDGRRDMQTLLMRRLLAK